LVAAAWASSTCCAIAVFSTSLPSFWASLRIARTSLSTRLVRWRSSRSTRVRVFLTSRSKRLRAVLPRRSYVLSWRSNFLRSL
jgi:hypothetical protein